MLNIDDLHESAVRVLFIAAIEQERCAEVADALWHHRGVRLDWDGRLEIVEP
jgi:hypothetical protein